MAWHLRCLGFFWVDNLLAFLLERLATEDVTAFFFFFFSVDKSGTNVIAFFFLYD